MRCNNCNTECPNTATTCWRCGAQLRNANQGMQRGAQRGGYGNAPIGAAQAAKKPLGAGAIAGIIGGAVALVAIIVVIIVVAAKGGSGTGNSSANPVKEVKYSSYISSSKCMFIAVNNSGDVYCTDYDDGYSHGTIDGIENWKNIKAVYTRNNCIAGIRNDGTVVFSYYPDGIRSSSALETIKRDSAEWTDIVQLSLGEEFMYGLKSDGTVVVAGEDEDFGEGIVASKDFYNLTAHKDIKQLPINPPGFEDYIVPFACYLKNDGTVGIAYPMGKKSFDEYYDFISSYASSEELGDSERFKDYCKNAYDVSSWKDIAYVFDLVGIPVGITTDGRVVANEWLNATQDNNSLTEEEYNRLLLSDKYINRLKQYTNVKKIVDCYSCTLILKRDGTVEIMTFDSEDLPDDSDGDGDRGLDSNNNGNKTSDRITEAEKIREEVSNWRNVEDVVMSDDGKGFIGLKSDGTLYTTSNAKDAEYASWTGIKTDGYFTGNGVANDVQDYSAGSTEPGIGYFEDPNNFG